MTASAAHQALRALDTRSPEHSSARLDRRSVVRHRDAHFRHLLATADLFVAAIVLPLTTYVSATSPGVELAAVLRFRSSSFSRSCSGLYDRDELVLHKSTLDEAPAVFQLPPSSWLLVWLGESFLIDGAFTKPQFAVLWVGHRSSACSPTAASPARSRTRTAPAERCLVLGPPRRHGGSTPSCRCTVPSGAEIVARRGPRGRSTAHVHVSGRLADLVDRTGAERLILVPRATESDAVLDLIREAKVAGREDHSVAAILRGPRLLGRHRRPARHLAARHAPTWPYAFIPGAQAVVRPQLSALALLAIAPLMLAIALAIKLDSRGPVFYRQRRIGRDGTPFTMFKFRTMVDGADELKAELRHLNEARRPVQDRRRSARHARRPGAAPERPRRAAAAAQRAARRHEPRRTAPANPRRGRQRVVGRHRDRLCLLPGMTGDWQVMGAARIPLQEMVAIDYLYVANWSLWSDMKCLLRTVPYMMRRARALTLSPLISVERFAVALRRRQEPADMRRSVRRRCSYSRRSGYRPGRCRRSLHRRKGGRGECPFLAAHPRYIGVGPAGCGFPPGRMQRATPSGGGGGEEGGGGGGGGGGREGVDGGEDGGERGMEGRRGRWGA